MLEIVNLKRVTNEGILCEDVAKCSTLIPCGGWTCLDLKINRDIPSH